MPTVPRRPFKKGTCIRMQERRIRLGGRTDPLPEYHFRVIRSYKSSRSDHVCAFYVDVLVLENIHGGPKAGKHAVLCLRDNDFAWLHDHPSCEFRSIRLIDTRSVRAYFKEKRERADHQSAALEEARRVDNARMAEWLCPRSKFVANCR